MKKKLAIALSLAMVMTMALTACGGDNGGSSSNKGGSSSAQPPAGGSSTSQPGGAALPGLRSPLPPEPARPGGPGRQLHSKAGAQTAVTRFAKHGRQVVRSQVQQDAQSAGGSRLQVQQKQQLQG